MGLGGKEECAWQRTDLYDMLGSKEKPHATPIRFLLRNFL